MAGDSKTEKATPKRRRDERKKGNVLMSKDAVGVATLIGSLFMVQVMSGVFLDQIKSLFHFYFAHMASDSVNLLPSLMNELTRTTVVTFVIMVWPFLAVTALLAWKTWLLAGN